MEECQLSTGELLFFAVSKYFPEVYRRERHLQESIGEKINCKIKGEKG